jgi:probable F420-dependent oxidoreductase
VQCDGPTDAAAWAETARKIEDLGYSTLSVADHFDNDLSPVAALTAAATATTTLRIGALVFANDFRHPVVLARDCATLDVMSGGRLELGVGAGWQRSDYESTGLPYDRPGIRIERLGEALSILKSCFAGESFDFAGDHYEISSFTGRPTVVQTPHPPILIGGGGRRILSLAAREADIIGINPSLHAGRIDEEAGPTGTADATDEKIRWIRAAAGNRFTQIELQTRIHIAAVTDDPRAMAEVVGPVLGISADEALDSPHSLVGEPSEIVEKILAVRERYGISYFTWGRDSLDAMAPVVARLAGT